MRRLAPALCGLILSTSVPALDIKASPTVINYAGTFGVTWNGAPGKPGDWLGIYTAGAPDSNPWMWVMAEAPSWTWLTQAYYPVNANYEFRLFCCNSFQKLGTSNHVWVQDPNAPVVVPSPQPAPDPTPQPQPSGAVVYDLTGATWYPGPIINGMNYSPGANSSYVGTIGPWPSPPGEIDYVTTPAPGPLPYGGKIIFRYRLTNGPLLGTVDPVAISSLHLHIQRRGDNWGGQGGYAWYRAWSLDGTTLTNVPNGEFTISVPLTGDHWTGVFTAPHQDFASLLANAEVVGFTFGDAQSKGHGNQNSTGARVEIIEYTIRGP
jgi:hypothetical protein